MRKKSKVQRIRNSCIVIKCEGDTEKVYFSNFSSRETPIHFAAGNCKDPEGMFNELCNYIKTNDYSAKEYGDKIYLVLDTDVDLDRIKTIESLRKTCDEKGIEIITSAPTFEVWFLMHFGNVSKQKDSKSTKKELKKYIPGYKEGLNVIDKLGNMQIAINEEKRQELYAESNGEDLINHNPHSLVYRIVN